jgi:HAD superfamily hydrolase (TIGR01509 family)
MPELKALLFDVDGTLADTERDGHRLAFNRAFTDAGLDWDWTPELYGQLLAVTGGKERIRFYLDKFNTGFRRPAGSARISHYLSTAAADPLAVTGRAPSGRLDVVSATPAPSSGPRAPSQRRLDALATNGSENSGLGDFIRGLHLAKTDHYTRMLAEGAIPLRSGVKRLIEEARAEGLRLAVATTTTPANVEALLVHALAPDAMSWFEVIAAGDVVPAKKPAPDIYTYAMNALDLGPESCIAFEDSHNGILASRGAGLKTIIAVNGYTRHDDFSGAAIVLDQWGEPDTPFTVLAGDAGGARCLDLALVKRLHRD